jgi:spermidine synthase
MCALCAIAIGRPLIFTWCLAMLMLALGGWQQIDISTIDKARQRSFFGVYTVQNSHSAQVRKLLHGTTLHGAQSLVAAKSHMPLTYYAPGSGVGLAMQAAPSLFGPKARVGVIGLGTGSLTCYATPTEDWTIFEIDPLMVELATDRQVFSFVSQCKPDVRIVVGDARLKLAEEPADRFDVLVVDAFSSDAIPLHLLTREAFGNYRRALAPGGVLLVHISNRFLDLEPVVAALASDMGISARGYAYRPSPEEQGESYNASIWIALTDDDAAMTRFTESTGHSEGWLPLRGREGFPAWTDGFASVLPVLKPLSGEQ